MKFKIIRQLRCSFKHYLLILFRNLVWLIASILFPAVICFLLFRLKLVYQSNIKEEPLSCSLKQNFLIQSPSWSKPAFEELLCRSKAPCNGSQNQFYSSKSSPNYEFLHEENKKPSIWISEDDELFSLLMIEDERQLFTKVFEKWSKLKEIFAIFKKPTLGQFLDSEISLNSVLKDDSLITDILENEEMSKNNTQFYDNKNKFSVNFSIRKALFNAKNLEEELCDDSVGEKVHQNHFLLNCLCRLPYEEVKKFFIVLGRNLDFNKIYQKAEELNLMERKYEWTEKEERIFSKLKGSLLKLSPLRSLSKIFLSLKNVLKNLENPKIILKDSGWTSVQVQRLLGYLIELGKEKNFRDFIFLFLEDKILFEETKGKDLINSQREKKKNLTFEIIVLINTFLKQMSGRNSCTEKRQHTSPVIDNTVNLLNLSNHILSGLEKEPAGEHENFQIKNESENERSKSFHCYGIKDKFPHEETRDFDSCYGGKIIREFFIHFLQIDDKNFWNDFFSLMLGDDAEAMKFRQNFSNWIESLLNSESLMDSFIGFEKGKSIVKKFIFALNETISIIEDSLKKEKVSIISNTLSNRVLEMTADEATDLVEEFLILKSAGFLTGKNYVSPDCNDDNNRWKVCPPPMFSNLFHFHSPFFDKIFQINFNGSNGTINVEEILCRLHRFRNLVSDLSEHFLIPEIIQKFADKWQKENFDIFEEKFSQNQSNWIYKLGDTIWKNLRNSEVFTLMETITKIFLNFENLINELLSVKDFFLNDSWLKLFEIIHRLSSENKNETLMSMSTLDEFCKVDEEKSLTQELQSEEHKFLCSFNSTDFQRNLIRLKTGLVNKDMKMVPEFINTYELWNASQTFFEKLNYLQLLRSSRASSSSSSSSSSFDFVTLFEETKDQNFQDFFSKIFTSNLQEDILSQDFLYHIYIFNNIIGDTSEETFKDLPVFNKLKKVINQQLPSALQEFALLIKTKPRLIHILHQPIIEGRPLCQVDISTFGKVINKVFHYFCNFSIRELNDELKILEKFSYFVQDGRKNLSVNELPKFILLLNQGIVSKKGESNSGENFSLFNWTGIFPSVLNVTMEEIYENGSRIWAEMMLPLVMESRKERPKSEKLRDILKSLNGYLRQLKLSLKLISGGDIWTNIKDCYQDKPFVLEVIELIEEVPDLVNELLIFYAHGNYTVNRLISSTENMQDICSFHFDLFSKNKMQKSSNFLRVKKIFDLFCDESLRNLIFDQLEPNSLPIIANMTMEPDAAILGLLLDTVTWDLFLLQKGFFIEKHVQIPDWLRPFRWRKASKNFIQLFSKTFREHMAISFQIKREELKTKPFDIQRKFLKSLKLFELWIEDMRGKNLKENKNFLLKEFASFVLWATQTKSYYKLISGLPVEDVVRELCEESVVNLSQENYRNDSEIRINELFLCEMSKVFFAAENESSEANDAGDVKNLNSVADSSITKTIFDNIIGSFLGTNPILKKNSKKMTDNDVVCDVIKVLFLTIINYESKESSQEKNSVLKNLKYINHFIDIYINKGETANSEENSVEHSIRDILKSLPLKIKGGKWTNNAEEILEENLILEKKFDLYFEKLKEDFVLFFNCSSLSDNPSCSNFKLYSGFFEALTEFYLIMKNDREKDSLSLLLNETKEQGRSIFTLHQMLQPISKDAFDWDDDTAYIIILSSLIYNSSKAVRILESTDYNLDNIVEILLTFSEVLDELDMKQITFQNFTSHKNFRSNFYLLQNLKKSVAGVRDLVNDEVLSETHLGEHLENIHSGINMFLNKTLSRKRIFQHVYLNEFVERESLPELKSILRKNSCNELEDEENQSFEIPFHQLAVFYKNWWQKFQKVCDRTANVETDEEEENDILKVFCNLSSRNDSIKKLLEQADISQVFYQVEKTLLYETLNKSNISEVEVQENYVKFNYELEGINQLKNLSQFLLKISFFEEDSNVSKRGEESTKENSRGFIHQLQKLYCRESETITESGEDITTTKIKKNTAVEDMCNVFDELFFEEENSIPNLLRSTHIFIVPKNEMTISLSNMMNKTFEEVAERVKFVKRLKTLIKEGCFSLLANISDSENFLKTVHWFTSAFYSSLAIDLNLLNKHIQTFQSLCYNLHYNRQMLISVLDSFLKWFSCFDVKNRIKVSNEEDLQSQTLLLKNDNYTYFNLVLFGNDSSNISTKVEELEAHSNPFESLYNYNLSSARLSGKENENKKTIKLRLHIQAMVERFLSQKNKRNESEIWGFDPQNESKILRKSQTRIRRDNFGAETNFALEKYDVLAVPVNFSCNGMDREFYGDLKSSAEFISVLIVFLFGFFLNFTTITFSSTIHSVSHEVKILHSFRKWINFLPLLLSSLIMVILQATLATFFLNIFGIFIRSEVSLLFVILFLFGLNIMRISYFVASWSSSKLESVVVTQSIIILSLVPFWYISANGLSELYSAKIFSLFFPTSCFAFVLRTLLRFEIFGVGASFSLSQILPPAQDEDLTLFVSILFLFLNFLLLNLIFFVCKLEGKDAIMKLASTSLFMRPSSVQKDILNVFEERKTSIEKALSGEILKTVEAIALQKLFMINGKPFLFGENLSFEMFENQVHVFYGPPKSGKTTILSMIAGISQPSSGYISVCGLNPASSLKRNLETVSFSPSETSLTGDLTVYEIFYYFSLLRWDENRSESVKEKTQSMICDLGLNDWKNKRMSAVPKDLQKLVSVGVSLAGNAKVFLLDEPLKGVQSSLLRPVWKLISKMKKDKTFIITSKETFEMENVADSIGLLKEGHLIYSGSLESLMSEFSPGYNIVVYNKQDIRTLFNGDQKIGELEEYFQEYFPRISFKSFGKENFEITFHLPYEDVQNYPEKLCHLFRELEMRTEELGISYTRVCHPNLKSILQFALHDKKISNFWQTKIEEDLELNFNSPEERSSKWFPFSHLLILFQKRYLHNIRQKYLILQYLSIPFVFFIIGTTLLWISKHMLTTEDSKDLQRASSLHIGNGFYAFPSNFPGWSEYERNLEKYFIRDDEMNEPKNTLRSEQINQCDIKTTKKNFIFKYSSVCAISNEKVNLTDCVCHNENCVLKMNFGWHNLVIPFNKKYFKIIYLNLWLELQNLKNTVVIGYDFDEEESLFQLTNVMRKANIKTKTIKHFEPWIEVATSNNQEKIVELFISLGSLYLLIGASFGVLLTTSQVVKQRLNEDHFIILSKGVSKLTYWASNFLWDTGIIVLCGLLVIVAIIPYQFYFNLDLETITSIFLLTILYGWSLQSTIYCASILCEKKENYFVSKLLLFSVAVGLLSNLIIFVCEELCTKNGLEKITFGLHYIFHLIPQYVYAKGTATLIKNALQKETEETDSYFIASILWIGINFIILSFLEEKENRFQRFFLKRRVSMTSNQAIEKEIFVNSNLSLVVSGLQFQVPLNIGSQSIRLDLYACKNESLTIVGMNNKERKKFIRYLVGDIRPPSGTLLLVEEGKHRNYRVEKGLIGYCPPMPTLDSELTVEEELKFELQLQGFNGITLIHQRVQETILKLDLNHFKNKLIKYLDKDVARRTALAKAVIGGPKILLIDDSYEDNIFQCRKTLRSVIRSACSKGCTVIILSKDFEEAEFLSERLATFEGGRIVHIGNIKAQHESSNERYIVKIKAEKIQDISQITKIIKQEIQEFTIIEKYDTKMVADTSSEVTPYLIFGAISKARKVAPFWYEVSSIFLPQYYQQLGLHPSRHSSYSSTNNSLINEIPNVIFTEDDSCSSLTFPEFDKPRSQRENLHDNNQREVLNDNLYQCHRRTLSNRMRRGSGGSKLTPCSTPQPPRTPPEVQQCKPKLKSLEDVHLFCDGNPHLSSSSKTPTTFTKSKDYFPPISQRSSDSLNKDTLVEDYLKRQNEKPKSRGMIDRFIENLPKVNTNEDLHKNYSISSEEENVFESSNEEATYF